MDDQDYSDDGFDMDDGNTLSPAPSANNDPLNDSKRHARAQHNALERRRRDNIKDMYCSLKDEIPNFQNDRASRAQILKKAYDSIQTGTAEMKELGQEVDKIEELNRELRKQLEMQAQNASMAQQNNNCQQNKQICGKQQK